MAAGDAAPYPLSRTEGRIGQNEPEPLFVTGTTCAI